MKGTQNFAERTPTGGSRRRILVVDDDAAIRELSTKVLSRFGYQVDAAPDGAAAWETLKTEMFDLLITDQEMPEVSGVELLKRMHAAHMAVPVIMSTGALPREEFARCPWLQPAAMLPKPYSSADLLGAVREVLRAPDGAAGQMAAPSRPSMPPSGEGLRF